MPRTVATLFVAVLLMPSFTLAFPFGGRASFVAPCYNAAIFARLGPPRGGDFVWVPSTKTYSFGPPTRAGQWILGLASVPYFCLISVAPVMIIPAVAIDMMGSSR